MRSIKAYETVRAAIHARRQQEALVVLMKAVERLAIRVNEQAAAAYEAAADDLGGDSRATQFVIVDGETWGVNAFGVHPFKVEVL